MTFGADRDPQFRTSVYNNGKKKSSNFFQQEEKKRHPKAAECAFAYLGGVEALRSAVMSEREPVGVRGAAGGAAGGEGGVAGAAAARGGELAGSRLARSTILQKGNLLASAYSYIPSQVELPVYLKDEFLLELCEKVGVWRSETKKFVNKGQNMNCKVHLTCCKAAFSNV